MIEYNVIIYKEGIIGSLLFGSSKVNPEKFTDFLNQYGIDGWRVVTMEKDIYRTLLFFVREAYVVVMAREK